MSCILCTVWTSFAKVWTGNTMRSTINTKCPNRCKVYTKVSQLFAPKGNIQDWWIFVIEHCLEQLRQTIQCAGDLTPVPIRPYGEGKESSYIGTSQVHTCRNWDTFRKWYTKRGDEYGTVRWSRAWNFYRFLDMNYEYGTEVVLHL